MTTITEPVGHLPDLAPDSPAPDLRTELPGPVARQIIARDEARHAARRSPASTRSSSRAGAGRVIEDVDGNRFLDFNAGIAVNAAGHAHPAVNAAIHAQVDDVPALLLERLLPPGLRRGVRAARRLGADGPTLAVFLANSGTEAVEGALKLARHHTGRPNVIAFYGAFHGRSLGSLSLTVVEGQVPQRLRHRHARQLPRPDSPYDGELHRRRRTSSRCCSPHDRARRRGRDLRRADPGRGRLHRPAGRLAGRRSASCATARHPARDRRGAVRRRAHRHDVGVRARRRRARHHHRRQGPGQRPAARRRSSPATTIMEWAPGKHGSTFGGNPVACAAAVATLDLVERRPRRQRRRASASTCSPACATLQTDAAADHRRPRPRPDDRHRPPRPRHRRRARAGVLRARPARAHVRQARHPPGAAARRHRRAGRHRRWRSSPTPCEAARPADR